MIFTQLENDDDLLKQLEELSISNFSSTYFSKDTFKKSISSNNERTYLLLDNSILIGYVFISKVLDEVEIYQICISKIYQNNGYGKILLDDLFELLEIEKVKKIFLEVRKSNINAIKLYEKSLFKQISVRKNYYEDNLEDALIYEKELIFNER